MGSFGVVGTKFEENYEASPQQIGMMRMMFGISMLKSSLHSGFY